MNAAVVESNLTVARNGSIGKYELLRELGSGATSTVYLARDRFQQREVAVKVLHANHLESEEGAVFQRMFFTEARLVGKLRHPHVVAILDAAVDDKGCYIVMEFIDGSTLEEYCKPGQLPAFDVAVDVAYKCCKGLAFAQRHGLIHRDIKPANILMARDGRIKVTDFGAALSPKLAQITHISGLGSVAYMSPQQIRGDHRLTFHTDIYSLGVVLFKMLTGRTPFPAQTLEELTDQIVNRDVPAPSSLRAAVPSRIDRIVRRARALSRENASNLVVGRLPETLVPDPHGAEVFMDLDAHDVVHAGLQGTHSVGRGHRGRDNDALRAPCPDGHDRRAHGRPGCDAVVDDDHGLASHVGQHAAASKALDASLEFRRLARADLLEFALVDPCVALDARVDVNPSTLGDCAHGKLGLRRHAELANHPHIERRAERMRDLGSHGHAAAG